MIRATWMKLFVCAATLWLFSISQCWAQILAPPIVLPEIRIDDRLERAHTQGLFVTAKHFLVTSRLESRPKRALLFRFSRSNPDHFEFIDLTPTHFDQALNHPGGFDRDQNGVYWIPVSTSNRRGPTVIFGLTIDEDRSLADSLSIHSSIRVPDHLGALCCVNGQLVAASWDTAKVYRIRKRDGKTVNVIDRSKFIASQPDWFLAVQDWKYDETSDQIIAGSIDKSTNLSGEQPRAVVSRIDLRTRSVESEIRISPRRDVARPMTNEGLAMFGGELFLLPEDLGAGAKIFRMSSSALNR